eukprot:TRINITY_DN21615_c0_g1_i1.p1 TRINITY_DN21615_c0_g1~~TRINITY_DN21615_c0_g1_i1.p1  ORF type:complete len:624 (+),score=149.30 TRINITY_DN21615_c0_g1_i1:191-2062(+)
MDKWRTLVDSIPEDDRPEDPEEAYNRACIEGSNKHSRGDLEGAVSDWTEALRLNPSDATVWWQRGSLLAQLGHTDNAFTDFGEAIARDPTKANAYFSRGSLRSDLGDVVGAMDDFGECLRHEPDRVDAWCCRGTARLEHGDAEGAANDADKALRIDKGGAAPWGLRGAARHRLGDHLGAIEDCQRALEIEPELTWAKDAMQEAIFALELERSRDEEGQDEDEEEATDTKKSDKKKQQDSRANASNSGPQSQKPPMQTSGGGARFREEGNMCFKKGDLPGAVEAYQKAYEAYEQDWVLALSNQAICYLKLKAYEQAVVAADLCLVEKGAPHKARLTKFKALSAMREWVGAFETLRLLRELRVGAEVEAAAEQEECARRRERVDLCAAAVAAGESGDATAVNAGDDAAHAAAKARGVAELRNLEQSLPGAVEVALAQTNAAEKAIVRVDIVGAGNEDPFAFGQLPHLANEAVIRLVSPDICSERTDEAKEVAGKTIRAVYCKGLYHEAVDATDVPDLVVLCRPSLGANFEEWAAVVKHLIGMRVPTVVTGDNLDASLVQNEDLLIALGCSIVVQTMKSPHGCWVYGTCRNYHVLAFRGGVQRGLALVPALKRRLEKRGIIFGAAA